MKIRKKYTLFFEFYGRNMQTTVTAPTEEAAKNIVSERLKFIKVVEASDKQKKENDVFDEAFKMFGDIFDKFSKFDKK